MCKTRSQLTSSSMPFVFHLQRKHISSGSRPLITSELLRNLKSQFEGKRVVWHSDYLPTLLIHPLTKPFMSLSRWPLLPEIEPS